MDRDKEERHLTRVKNEITGYAEILHASIRFLTRLALTTNLRTTVAPSTSERISAVSEALEADSGLPCLGVVSAGLWTTSQTPVYRARTSVEIVGSSDRLNGNSPDLSSNADSQTQAKVLESRSLKRRVLRKLQASGNESSPGPVNELAHVPSTNTERPVTPKPPARVSIWPTVKSLFLPGQVSQSCRWKWLLKHLRLPPCQEVHHRNHL